MKRLSAILLVGALVFGTVGCTNMNKTQQGLLSGAAGGAILGAGLGALTGGSGTTGALIGGGLHLGDHHARGHAGRAAQQNVNHELSSFLFPHHAGTTLRDHRTSDRNILITPPK